MSRYIDKDKLIDSLPNIDANNNQQISKVGALRDFIFMIEEQPEADVVKVVHCKDCKWWKKLSDSCQGKCFLIGNYALYPTGFWYCANGERKENEQ